MINDKSTGVSSTWVTLYKYPPCSRTQSHQSWGWEQSRFFTDFVNSIDSILFFIGLKSDHCLALSVSRTVHNLSLPYQLLSVLTAMLLMPEQIKNHVVDVVTIQKQCCCYLTKQKPWGGGGVSGLIKNHSWNHVSYASISCHTINQFAKRLSTLLLWVVDINAKSCFLYS